MWGGLLDPTPRVVLWLKNMLMLEAYIRIYLVMQQKKKKLFSNVRNGNEQIAELFNIRWADHQQGGLDPVTVQRVITSLKVLFVYAG